jgi:hypothetical protein
MHLRLHRLCCLTVQLKNRTIPCPQIGREKLSPMLLPLIPRRFRLSQIISLATFQLLKHLTDLPRREISFVNPSWQRRLQQFLNGQYPTAGALMSVLRTSDRSRT